jgi:hypothetical protein
MHSRIQSSWGRLYICRQRGGVKGEEEGDILVTSSKKKPNTNANKHPSTKSIPPLTLGVFTAIVYNTKNKNIKNKLIIF